MTYLEDPTHDWSIDPVAQCSFLDFDQVITDLNDRIHSSLFDPPHQRTELELIVRGAMELARRTEAPLAQCLETSMIWYYG